jgi:hypothetical protein
MNVLLQVQKLEDLRRQGIETVACLSSCCQSEITGCSNWCQDSDYSKCKAAFRIRTAYIVLESEFSVLKILDLLTYEYILDILQEIYLKMLLLL